MERQNSVTKIPATNDTATKATATTTSAVIRPRIRRRKTGSSNNWILFGILRSFAILGPLAFSANIIYFTFYMHRTDYHLNFHELHPLSALSKSVHHRLTAMGLEQREVGVVLSGTAVLKRLQQRVKSSWNECGNTPKSATALTVNLQQQLQPPKSHNNLRHSGGDSLSPFGILEELEHYFNSEEVNATQKCQIPQRGMTACNIDSFSIVVTFQGEHNFRPLFMNLLSWLRIFMILIEPRILQTKF